MVENRMKSALKYIEIGLKIIPCWWIEDGACACPKGKSCNSAGKHPMTKRGIKDATDDEEQILIWWSKFPQANIAISTDSFCVVDVDKDKGGMESFMKIKNLFPECPTSKTGGGGLHLFYKQRPGIIYKNQVNLIPGIDLRAVGGYVIAPPSTHIQGVYEWQKPFNLVDLPLAPDLVKITFEFDRKQETIFEGERNTTLFKYACSLRSKNVPENKILELIHQKNSDCNPPLDPREMDIIYRSALRYPPGGGKTISFQEEHTELSDQDLFTRFPSDQSGHAACFNAMQKDFLYTEHLGWLEWKGTHWDNDGAEIRLEKKIDEFLNTRRNYGITNNNDKLSKISITSNLVSGVKKLYIPYVLRKASEFDNNPDKIFCKNCAVNLITGETEEHQKENLNTSILPINYDPEEIEPRWIDFLEDVLTFDQDLIEFVQIAIGYSLTGHISEECLFYVFGPTRAGKGVFTETIMAMLGKPLGSEVDFETFSAPRTGDTQNFDLAPLKAARFITAAESSKHTALNAAKIKQLTGGNEVRCAFKFGDHFNYLPQFKIWLTSNHKANIDSEDDAAWGRLRIIYFPNSFLGREDRKKKSEFKKPEFLTGVLSWAVQGAVKWYMSGLPTPIKIKEQTLDQRNELDYIPTFIEECLEVLPDRSIGAALTSQVYQKYKQWCLDNGFVPKHHIQFNKALANRGIRKEKQGKKQVYTARII